MKRTLLIMALALFGANVYAQDCEALVLPLFGGNTNRMLECPQEKIDYHCRYARSAFYVTDSMPSAAEGELAVAFPLSRVVDKSTGEALDEGFVVDLETLNYYAYTFRDLQLSFPRGNVVIFFSTPASEHRYLVMRSLYEMHDRAEFPEKY